MQSKVSNSHKPSYGKSTVPTPMKQTKLSDTMKLNTKQVALTKKPNLEVVANSKVSSGNSTTSKTPLTVPKDNTPDAKNPEGTKENRKPNENDVTNPPFTDSKDTKS